MAPLTPKKEPKGRKQKDSPMPKPSASGTSTPIRPPQNPNGRSETLSRRPVVERKKEPGTNNQELDTIREKVTENRAVGLTLHASSIKSVAADRNSDIQDEIEELLEEMKEDKDTEERLREELLEKGDDCFRAMQAILKNTVSELRRGHHNLKKLEKKQLDRKKKLERLREKMASCESKAKFQAGWIESHRDTETADHEGAGAATLDAAVELQKVTQNNGAYIPEFPVGIPGRWTNKNEWTNVLRLSFLEVIRKKYCSREEWPDDLTVWRGKTQKMLQKYLAPYLESEEMKTCVMTLGHASTYQAKKWPTFKKAIHDSDHSLFSDHYTTIEGFGPRSSYFVFYLGILRSFNLQDPTDPEDHGDTSAASSTAGLNVDNTIVIEQDYLEVLYEYICDELFADLKLLGVRRVQKRCSTVGQISPVLHASAEDGTDRGAVNPTNSTGTARPASASQSDTRKNTAK